jgi:hypothetical protein
VQLVWIIIPFLCACLELGLFQLSSRASLYGVDVTALPAFQSQLNALTSS